MPADMPIYYAPKGERWPWYPVYRGRAEMVEKTMVPDDDGYMSLGFTMQATSDMAKGRVGLRRWVKTRWALLRPPSSDGTSDAG